MQPNTSYAVIFLILVTNFLTYMVMYLSKGDEGSSLGREKEGQRWMHGWAHGQAHGRASGAETGGCADGKKMK